MSSAVTVHVVVLLCDMYEYDVILFFLPIIYASACRPNS